MYAIALLTAAAFADPLPLKGGAGVFFHAGGTFMNQPLENEVDGYLVPAQGWGGFGPGGGLALELRAFDVVGLELDIIRRTDVARTTFTLSGVGEFPFEARQPAWHIPVLVKVGMPTGVVRPNLVGGGQFIIPGDPSNTQPDGIEIDVTTRSEAYKAWAFGLGFEFAPKGLPIDLRIPLNLRGAYNTGVGNSSSERADYTFFGDTISAIDYRTVWRWHASASLGVSVFFP